MPDSALSYAIASLPAGAWAVGVSGGADSVALLLLLHERRDLSLHVVHLDHQTRGAESTADADFVRNLAGRLSLPCTLALRSEIEVGMTDLPVNTSSRYRAVRIALFRKVVADHGLSGVVLAHHADDQAETVLVRLLRGSGAVGLAGMENVADLGGLRMARPLLGVRRELLRSYLQSIDQSWREDASNESDKYLRNRLRRLLVEKIDLHGALLQLADACGALRTWARSAAPSLGAAFSTSELADLPPILARESASRWMIERGVRPDHISPDVVARLILMATDAASPARTHFPGGVLVWRRGGRIGVVDPQPQSI